MRLGVLIMVHKEPQQVARLCRRLRSEGVEIYVHVDSKVDEKPFKDLLEGVSFVTDRVDVKWGHYSQIIAMLNLASMVENKGYDYVAFISGQDYPVRPINEILDLLKQNMGKQYIQMKRLNPEEDKRQYLKKVLAHPYIKNKVLGAAYRKLLYKLPVARRKYPTADGEIYFGSCWWILTGRCVDFVLDYHRRNPKFLEFHKYVLCGDENFVQSIVAYSEFAKDVTEYCHYIDWSAQLPNPKILTTDDFSRIVSSGKWFARKFDIRVDDDILDLIDNQ